MLQQLLALMLSLSSSLLDIDSISRLRDVVLSRLLELGLYETLLIPKENLHPLVHCLMQLLLLSAPCFQHERNGQT